MHSSSTNQKHVCVESCNSRTLLREELAYVTLLLRFLGLERALPNLHHLIVTWNLNIVLLFLLTAWVGSLAYGSTGIFGPLVGVLSDRFNPRIIAIIGGFIATTALIVTSQAPNLTLMYFSYGILYGFGSSCVFFVVLIILQRYFIKNRSMVTGLAVTGPGGGLLIMSPVIQILLNNTTWRMTFMSMAGIVFLTCILSCSFDPNVASEGESSDHHNAQAGRLNRCASLDFSYLNNKEYLVYLVASSVAFSGIAIPIVHLVSYEPYRYLLCRKLKLLML